MISGNLLKESIELLVEAGIDKDDARFDIEALEDLLISGGEADFRAGLLRRAKGEPVAYITGRKWFYQEEYNVVPGVLIPRSDTEILVEAALRYMGAIDFPMGDISKVPGSLVKDDYKIVDLCTGTGCVGISVANALAKKNKKVQMLLGDISPIAIDCAKSNVETSAINKDINVINIDVLNDDYEVLGKVDVVVSNPPYVTDSEMEQLPKDVKDYEPELALRASNEGLIFYEVLAKKCQAVLNNNGALIVEHGYAQGESVREIFVNNGYMDVCTIKDYGGNDRVTIGRKK